MLKVNNEDKGTSTLTRKLNDSLEDIINAPPYTLYGNKRMKKKFIKLF